MASNASVPARGLPPKPPDKGSFPLDHYGECTEPKKLYMQCLREHAMATQSDECRELSAAYLKCRMDRELMAKEDLGRLGLSRGGGSGGDSGGDGGGKPVGSSSGGREPAGAASASEGKERNASGFLAGMRGAK